MPVDKTDQHFPQEEPAEPQPPVPTREEIERERKAILQQARREGEEQRRLLLAQAQEEAVKLKEQARQEGYSQGYSQGYSEGEKEAEKLKEEARSVLEQAHRQHEEILAEAEPEILKIAVSLAEKLINYQLEVNTDLILSIVSRCLEALPGGQEIFLRVNPGDEMVCREKLNILEMSLKRNSVLEIVADEDIPPGSCRVDSEEAEVAFLLARELQVLAKKLLELAVVSGGKNIEIFK